METLDLAEGAPVRMLDVDNALALEDWRASGLGPCATILFERQVLGEYPNTEEVSLRIFWFVCVCVCNVCPRLGDVGGGHGVCGGGPRR